MEYTGKRSEATQGSKNIQELQNFSENISALPVTFTVRSTRTFPFGL